MPLDLVVSGATGRMGRALGRLIAASSDLRACGGIARPESATDSAAGERDPYPRIVGVDGAGDLVRRANVVVDFSAPAQLSSLLALHGDALAGRALVVGTTGLDPELEQGLDDAGRVAAVLVAPNFSVGVNLLVALVRRAAAALGPSGYDVEIIESHHARKDDAPSGTALALGRTVADARGVSLETVRRDGRSGRTGARRNGEIGFHALRGGDVVGDHAVRFLGALETVELAHSARSRDLFADGALVAARWLAGRAPGRYTMADVLGLEH